MVLKEHRQKSAFNLDTIAIGKEMDHHQVNTKLSDLPTDCLVKIASNLDARANRNLIYSNKKVYSKLVDCAFYWKHLCKLEGLDKVSSLSDEEINKDDKDRVTWSGELLHSIKTSEEASRWQKIYQRGIQMRRNLAEGKFDMSRLCMTDEDNFTVRKMTLDTQKDDQEFLDQMKMIWEAQTEVRTSLGTFPVRINHRENVKVCRWWNEEFLVVMQYSLFRAVQFRPSLHDIFVWKWEKCRNPVFLYREDLLPTYLKDLSPTSFFMYKNFFVLMPETGFSRNQKKFTSMVRVHDLGDKFKLVGKFDFAGDSEMRRHQHNLDPFTIELAHLHKLGDKAVALCRTPDLTILIFSIPDCKLEKMFKMKDLMETSYELLVLDHHRFMVEENTMMFLFHDSIFYDLETYGRLLQIDFDAYVHKKGNISIREYQKFDVAFERIEKICLINKKQVTFILTSGDIVIKDLNSPGDRLTIKVPEMLRQVSIDTDYLSAPTKYRDRSILRCGPRGDIIIAYRHFASGRKIHAYDKVGALLYEINVDNPMYDLVSMRGYISVDLKGKQYV